MDSSLWFPASLMFLLPVAGTAQPSLPAQQWIANCVSQQDSPAAQQPYTLLGKKPPSHEENKSWCVGQWNNLHPNQKVSNGAS
jgi:hypothetical protein